MAELTTRAYTPADAAALTEFLNLIERHAGGHPGWVAAEIATMVDVVVGDPATDTRLRFGPDGTLVAAALVMMPPDGGTRADAIGGVHPGWRGRGIGRELLDWQLRRAAEINRAMAPGTPWTIDAGAIVADEASIRLYRRFGMEPDRYWLEMVAPTADAPALPVPAGLRLVPYAAPMARDLHAAHMEAFEDHYGFQHRGFDDWARMTLDNESFAPELSLIAVDGDRIAGYVLSYTDAEPERVYIGQVGTRREWRKRGLAAATLVAVLRLAAQAGKKSAALGVDADSPTGAVGVYERAGFAVEFRAVTYRKPVGAEA